MASFRDLYNRVSSMIYNAGQLVKKAYDMFYNPNPLDVQVSQYDERGNLITTKIPNVAKFRKQVWDDIGGAIGQWNKRIYVDADNGNDSNPGTADAPLKTLEKVIDTIPVGGHADVYLYGGKTYYISRPSIVVKRKSVAIYNYGNEKAKLYFKTFVDGENRNNSTKFHIFGGQMFLQGVVLENEGIIDPNLTTWTHSSMFVGRFGISKVVLYNCDITLKGDAQFGLADSDGWTGMLYLHLRNCNIKTNGWYVYQITNNGMGMFHVSGCTIDDDTKWIAGVIRDSNGIPRNLISNKVF